MLNIDPTPTNQQIDFDLWKQWTEFVVDEEAVNALTNDSIKWFTISVQILDSVDALGERVPGIYRYPKNIASNYDNENDCRLYVDTHAWKYVGVVLALQAYLVSFGWLLYKSREKMMTYERKQSLFAMMIGNLTLLDSRETHTLMSAVAYSVKEDESAEMGNIDLCILEGLRAVKLNTGALIEKVTKRAIETIPEVGVFLEAQHDLSLAGGIVARAVPSDYVPFVYYNRHEAKEYAKDTGLEINRIKVIRLLVGYTINVTVDMVDTLELFFSSCERILDERRAEEASDDDV